MTFNYQKYRACTFTIVRHANRHRHEVQRYVLSIVSKSSKGCFE